MSIFRKYLLQAGGGQFGRHSNDRIWGRFKRRGGLPCLLLGDVKFWEEIFRGETSELLWSR